MFTALNGFNQKVHVDETIPNEHYVCESCGQPVFPRGGDKVCRHFYHRRNTCNDNWEYEIDGWHKEMQNLWPKENQEKVIRFNGEVHRADVLVDDMVIEIQHSHMSALEFKKRTSFFLNAGYRVAWIFDFTHPYVNNRITRAIPIHKPMLSIDDMFVAYRWSDSVKTFAFAPNVNGNDKFAVWVWLDPNHCKLEKITMMVKDEKKQYSMRYFKVDDNEIDFEQPVKAEYFFGEKQILSEGNGSYALVKYGQTYISPSERYMYISNMGTKDKYTCPRGRNVPFLKVFGEDGCAYCNGCQAIGKFKTNTGYGYKIMCDFANLPYHDAMNPYTKKERETPVPIIDEKEYIKLRTKQLEKPVIIKTIEETSVKTDAKSLDWRKDILKDVVQRDKKL